MISGSRIVAVAALVAAGALAHPVAADAVVVNTRVLVSIKTGGDDLRGGSDNVDVTLNFEQRTPLVLRNANGGRTWPNQSWNQVVFENAPGTPELTAGMIANVTLTTAFTGGIGGDNWNVDAITIAFEETHHDGRIAVTLLHSESASPLVRFTGSVHTYIARRNLLLDGSFESQRSRALSSPWAPEGVDDKGVDIGLGLGCDRCGNNNAFLTSSTRGNWNAIWQTIPLRQNTNYRLRGSLRTSAGVNTLFFGLRFPGVPLPTERQLGPLTSYAVVDVPFNSGPHTSAVVFTGFWGTGAFEFVQMDQLSVLLT